MIIVIPIEPINDLHHDKIIAAFSRLFIDGGGQSDGDGYGGGYGWGYGDGDGDGDGGGYGKPPEEWRVEP